MLRLHFILMYSNSDEKSCPLLIESSFFKLYKSSFQERFSSPTVAITFYLTSFESGCVSVGVLTIINPAAEPLRVFLSDLCSSPFPSSFRDPACFPFISCVIYICVLIQRVFLRLDFLSPSIISDVVQPSRHAAEDPPSSSVGTDSSSCSSRPARSSEEAA